MTTDQKTPGQVLYEASAAFNPWERMRPDAKPIWESRAAAVLAHDRANQPAIDVPSDQIIELTQAMEIRRILEEVKKVAAMHPCADMPTPFQSGFQLACEEIFYRATGEEWHMDEDAARYAHIRSVRASNEASANQPAESGVWQPIETAPYNERVIVWCEAETAMAWHDQIDNWWYFSPQGGILPFKPTHWQPLPAATEAPKP